MAVGGRKQTSFRCDEDLLLEFQADLARRGEDMSVVIAQWIWEYVRGGAKGRKTAEAVAASPFGQITSEEERVLKAVLRYWRERPAEDILRQMLSALPKLLGQR
jgi:hypothetical protein